MLSHLQLCTASGIAHRLLMVELVFQTIPVDSWWNTARQIQATDFLKFLPALTIIGSRALNSTIISEFSVFIYHKPGLCKCSSGKGGRPQADSAQTLCFEMIPLQEAHHSG